MHPQARPTAAGRAHEDFRARMRALLAEVRARGEPALEDQSISGLLLRLRDPKTGMQYSTPHGPRTLKRT